MSNKIKKVYTILYDDREKQPMLFLEKNFKLERTRLACGDYTVKGFEDTFAIERKNSWLEFYNSMTTNRENFLGNVSALVNDFNKAFMIIEDTVAGLARVQIPGGKTIGPCVVNRMISKVCIEYGLPIYMVGKGKFAEKLILELFNKAVEIL